MWGRREQLERLPVRRLRPVGDRPPGSWMPGTQSHEGIAGALEAIEYLADIGRVSDPTANRRAALAAGFETIRQHETALARRALDGFEGVDGLRVWGITDRERLDERVPTFSFTHDRYKATEIAARLGEQGIFVWHGNFYALPLTEALGLEPDGLVRVGLLHYNTEREVDRLVGALAEL
jgi:selenocysteine lyase/cysteine desulfurase